MKLQVVPNTSVVNAGSITEHSKNAVTSSQIVQPNVTRIETDSENANAQSAGVQIEMVIAPNKSPNFTKMQSVKENHASFNVKGENLQQLSTNALPPYSPSSPPEFLNSSSSFLEFHCCMDCGDTFISRSSLNFHLSRRSVLIKFPCESCNCILIFYNHCILQSHIRSHTDKKEKANISRATVNPLPRVFMDGIHNEVLNNLDDELNSLDDPDATAPSELLEFSLRESDTEISLLKEKQSTNVSRFRCLDCNKEFESFKERQEHMTNGEKIPSTNSLCDKCPMVCPSKCSLKAHQRIHLQISPYVCPECGDSPDPHWSNFKHHVDFKCFHKARNIGYKCPKCKIVVANNTSLLEHMESHTEKFYKCEYCPKAFMNATATKSHILLDHKNRKVLYAKIYKCSLCNIVHTVSKEMINHLPEHLKEQIREYIFNCMQCGKALKCKTDLYDHIKVHHPKLYKLTQQNESTIHSIYKVNKPANQHKGKIECLLCRLVFHNFQGYSVHMSKAHQNINQQCLLCFKVNRTRKDMLLHGKQHIEQGSILCLFCSNKTFSDKKGLDAHLISHIERMRFCTCCPVCQEILPDPLRALNHMREEHGMSTSQASNSATPNALNKELVPCHFCRLVFASDGPLRAHLKKEHGVNVSPDKTLTENNNTNEPPRKKPRVEGSMCAKCDYSSANREEFKKHIQTHKSNKSTFQCQECGCCFVVEPSLAMHLKIVHKITDPKKYIAEEGTNFAPDLQNPTEVTSRNALECSVCYTTFPSESSLKIHMRSHGMAFIQTKTAFSL
ncbi:zinc finger protein 532-like isoform X1 [Uloborus diversus]|uniref:zinc finger protein 532-like isoform X1 n=1 Tax=Uloborus diversus TaxID=327109 RepID=UPI0024097837|nr:zinc finger protein 532-like isoform X1 [Uloborus diversus]XP_054716682.1 zinc finger protein 532-like isoform X1 [Uloborus diversus]